MSGCPYILYVQCTHMAFARRSRLSYDVKRPKFGNGPLVRHPLSILLKNHISARNGVSNLVQRGEWLYIFFWTNKKINNWGSPLTLYGFQQLGHGMSKLGFE